MSERVIKFRAWHKQHKKMYNVGCLYWSLVDGELYGILVDKQTQLGGLLAGTDFDLMQFTGMVDRSGKEVYEGDILQDAFGHQAQVVSFVDMHHCMSGFTLRSIPPPEAYEVFHDWFPAAEIIGNVYQHPELLEVGQGSTT